MSARRAWLCDFDGTVSPHDVGASFMREFSPGCDAERESLLAAWQGEVMGSREVAEAECRLVRATAREALAFARRYSIDPGFPAFVVETEQRGDQVFIVSDGFDFYIDPLLEAAGLGHLPRASNRMRFADARVIPEFPHVGGCGRCGNCKGQHVANWRARGYVTVIVGDGYSDRCAARTADHVIARGSLADWCAAQGILAHEFVDFHDVARIARAWVRAPEDRPGTGVVA